MHRSPVDFSPSDALEPIVSRYTSLTVGRFRSLTNLHVSSHLPARLLPMCSYCHGCAHALLSVHDHARIHSNQIKLVHVALHVCAACPCADHHSRSPLVRIWVPFCCVRPHAFPQSKLIVHTLCPHVCESCTRAARFPCVRSVMASVVHLPLRMCVHAILHFRPSLCALCPAPTQHACA